MLVAAATEDDGDPGTRIVHAPNVPLRAASPRTDRTARFDTARSARNYSGLIGAPATYRPRREPTCPRGTPVHGVRERHLNPLRSGQGAHRRTRLHAFGDLAVGRGLGALERPSEPQPLAEGPVPRQRRRAGGHEVADARQARERRGVGSRCDSESDDLRESSGDQARDRVLPSPMPDAMPHASAITFLQAPRFHTRSRRCWCRAGNNLSRKLSGRRGARASSVHATTVAAGWPSAISRARFGPESTATRVGSTDATCETTSLIRSSVTLSMPSRG